MKNSLTLILVLFLLLSACESPETLILFSSGRNGNSDIFVMNMDGSDVKQLTSEPQEEWGAVWVSQVEICFLRQLDSGIVRIQKNIQTLAEQELPHPAQCILDDKNAIYTNSADQVYPCMGEVFYESAKGAVNLTENLTGRANYPSWSTSTGRVLITSNHGGSNDIYSVDPVTLAFEQLTDHPANDERGQVSPNGKWLAFSTDRFENGNQDIALMNMQTREVTRLTQDPGFDLIARWAGNSQTLLIGSNSGGNWDIYSLDIVEQNLVQLTSDEGFDGDPRVL